MKRALLVALVLAGCSAPDDGPFAITVEGEGRIWSPDADFVCDEQRCEAVVAEFPLRLHAEPAPGFAFAGWEGACGASPVCELGLAVFLGATFEAAPCPPVDEEVTGVVLYGQSLALGTQGTPALTTRPPFPGEVQVLDARGTTLCDAREGGSCGPWPDVESPRTAIVETWRRLRGAGRFVLTSSGFGSTKIEDLAEGSAHYAELMARIETSARLVGDGFVVRGVAFVHGPADEGSDDYEASLRALATDLERDIRAITDQRAPVRLFIDQTSSWTRPPTPTPPNVAAAQIAACIDDPRIVCVTPQYDLEHTEDRLHLVASAYRVLGRRFGEAMYRHVDECRDGNAPFIENAVATSGVVARYHTKDALVLDTVRCPARQDLGFELLVDGSPAPIRGITIVDDHAVRIDADVNACADDVVLRYAYRGDPSGGGGCANPGPRAPYGNLRGKTPALIQAIRVLCGPSET